MALHKTERNAWCAQNIFNLFPGRTPLLISGTPERCDAMVIGMGMLGTMWRMPVCTVAVRESRLTRAYLDAGDTFAVAFLKPGHAEQLRICGKQSGRDVDKVAACGFTVCSENGIPYFAQAETVLLCRVCYWQDVDLDHAKDDRIPDHYADGDLHRLYFGEVLEVLADDGAGA
jgi:flavin reductase (DIM6/NTAB) family NADH-FMN oxidoreductase RutF